MSSEKEKNTDFKHIEKEISEIKCILLLSNHDLIEKNLEKLISTNDRKLMWIYLDGEKTQEEIAKLVGITQASVSYFISYGKELGIIDDSEGLAKRTVNIIPRKWLEIKKQKEKEHVKK